MKDKILSLLGFGISPSIVASAVGCDPSYISQLLSDSSFSQEVAALRCLSLEQMRRRDDRYDHLEDELLEKLERVIPLMLRPREIIQALQMVNNAKRRSQEIAKDTNPGATIQNVIVLQLPTQTIRAFELNKNNEIIAVGDQPLIPMPTSVLMKELKNADSTRKIGSSQEDGSFAFSEETKRIVSSDSV